METLTIKELAPYLPYGLNMQYVVRGVVEKTGVLQSISHNENETHPTRVSISQLYNQEHIWMFKPLLRPLSDFNYPVWYDYPNKEMFYEDVKNQTVSVKIWNELLKDHVDVFNLIGIKLATDLNTIKETVK